MLNIFLICAFVICSFLIVYHHAIYPLFLSWYSKRHPESPVVIRSRGYRDQAQDNQRPSITIVVPAYNEERWIADKIRNLATLDYPTNRLKVIIACDGCTDQTAEIAQATIQEAACCETLFEIHVHRKNRGKVALLNHHMQYIDSDITGLSDVSALISIDALIIAEEHFKTERTGVVNSSYQVLDSANQGELDYWKYQSKIKQREATLGSTLGAHGAFYLFRTRLFTPLKSNTINDDFVLPMQIVKQGFIAKHEERMVAVEMEATSCSNDFKRRLRISAGNMQQVIRLASMFKPKYKGVAFAFLSGKGLRLVTPYLMIGCLTISAVLATQPIFLAALLLQVVCYAIAIANTFIPAMSSIKLCQLIAYMITGHYANLIGGLRYLLGMESERWSRINQ
ncbi:glycosyltransferase family 2 protein [Vibrio marisflavi]|uniref:Glycosyl transferase n=1 Tax=Vibrio marisflavi CECT 7928 TaxID=634439 RepID=A0ABM8ZYW2_9VIBR|nr:glycosyltransferase family 2 protein [Vibrio marisflavi]CAH0536142.1 hypothetical protein VMF7928_00236 [Vibrio marisflavi CECT 7928]